MQQDKEEAERRQGKVKKSVEAVKKTVHLYELASSSPSNQVAQLNELLPQLICALFAAATFVFRFFALLTCSARSIDLNVAIDSHLASTFIPVSEDPCSDPANAASVIDFRHILQRNSHAFHAW